MSLLKLVADIPVFITSCIRDWSFWFVFVPLFCDPFLVWLVSPHTSVLTFSLLSDWLPCPDWFHLLLVNLPFLL